MILHKRYKFCPECQSVMIRRIHRGWFQKHILRQKPKYGCGNCKAVFFNPLFEKDLKNLDKEEVEVSHETKPIISVEEVHAIDIVMAEKKENEKKSDKNSELHKSDVIDEYDVDEHFQAAFDKGFEEGFEQGFKKGMQH